MAKSLKHPKGLYLLFMTEMWERFSYYGMRALLVLYLTQSVLEGGMGFSEENATLLYGFFTGLVYMTPIIGGWLADRYLGQRRAITIGGITMMLGQFCLASTNSVTMLYLGLFLLIIGNGFFKPNISVLVGDLYEPGDKRRDSAFTIFYMGINIGAGLSPLVCGWLGMLYGYRAGFLAAGIGMLIGQLIFNLIGPKYLGNLGSVAVGNKNHPNAQNHPLTKEEKDRTWVIIIIVLFCVFFWAGFEQAGSSLTLYTEKYINRNVFGFEIPTAWFQSVNSFFIVLLAPVFSMLWTFLATRNKEPGVPLKMGLGMIMLGVGFLLMVMACLQRGSDNPDETVKANLLFLVGTYLFHTFGELLLSPIGLSMVTRLAPVKLASLLMGVWFLSSFVANIIGGFVASYASRMGAMSIFITIAAISVMLGLLLISMNKWLFKKSHGTL